MVNESELRLDALSKLRLLELAIAVDVYAPDDRLEEGFGR
jgi:hypothetical protein